MADDEHSDAKADRRGKERKATRIRAWADPGGVAAAADCLIVDMSLEGARVESVGDAPLPESFTLLNDAKSEFGAAKVMWRTQNMVGVKFESAGGPGKRSVNIAHEIGGGAHAGPRRTKPAG